MLSSQPAIFDYSTYTPPSHSDLLSLAARYGGADSICSYAGISPEKWKRYFFNKEEKRGAKLPYAPFRLLLIGLGEADPEPFPAFAASSSGPWFNTFSSGRFSPPPHTTLWKWIDRAGVQRDFFASFIGVSRRAVSKYLSPAGAGFKTTQSWALSYAQTRLILLGARLVRPERVPDPPKDTRADEDSSTAQVEHSLSNVSLIDGVILSRPERRGNGGPVVFSLGWKGNAVEPLAFKNTEHFDVEAWESVGERLLALGLGQGSFCTVVGRNRHNRYKGVDGKYRSSWPIRAVAVYPFEMTENGRVYSGPTPLAFDIPSGLSSKGGEQKKTQGW